MRILHQSPDLQAVFQQGIRQKVSQQRQELQNSLGNGLFGALGAGIFQLQQAKKQIKGSLGENFTSLFLMSFPQDWVMFQNALIPTTNGKLTEIDRLVIGEKGIFLIEVKTWKGSFAAYRDNWKRRENNHWIPLENSPTAQNLYHQTMFQQWMASQDIALPPDFISSPVVFPGAKWLGVKDCSVPVCQGIPELLQFIRAFPNRLTTEQTVKIAQFVQNYEISSLVQTSPKPKPVLRKKSLDS